MWEGPDPASGEPETIAATTAAIQKRNEPNSALGTRISWRC